MDNHDTPKVMITLTDRTGCTIRTEWIACPDDVARIIGESGAELTVTVEAENV